MTSDGFTALLDKKEAFNIKGAEFRPVTLSGCTVFKEGSLGVADSIDAVASLDLVRVPTYGLIRGWAVAERKGRLPDWYGIASQWYSSNAERITAYDENGIMGAKGSVYVLDIQNGGRFVWDSELIREAVQGNKLVNHGLQLSQEEIDTVLLAIKRKDYNVLRQLVHGRNVAYAGDYPGFLEASASPGFINGMETTYLVLRPVNKAREVHSGWQKTPEQRNNPDLIIAAGGKKRLGDLLDKALQFRWAEFGSFHGNYEDKNTGYVVALGSENAGVSSDRGLDHDSRFIGVAQEALNAFYNQENADSLTAIVNQAITTAKPVQYGDGILQYLPDVRVKEIV